MGMKKGAYHSLKSVQLRSFVWSLFSCIPTEYGDLLRKYPYSIRIQKNSDQKKLCIWTLFTQCMTKKLVGGQLLCPTDKMLCPTMFVLNC